MTTMKTTAAIEITGDASSANTALQSVADTAQETSRDGSSAVNRMDRSLDQMGDTAESTSRSLRDVGRESKSMGEKLAIAGNITTGVNAAFALAGRGVRMFTESMERYLRQTEDGDELWTQLERRIFAIKGAFAEALVGTDDVTEGFESLDTILGTVEGTLREVVSSVQLEEGAMVEHVRGGLSAFVRGLDFGQRGLSALRQASHMTELGIWAGRFALLRFREIVLAVASAIADFGVTAMGGLRNAAADVTEGIGRLAGGVGLGGLERRLSSGADRVRDMGDGLTAFAGGLDDAAWEAGQAADGAFKDLQDQIDEIGDAMIEEAGRSEELTTSFDELIASIRDGSIVRQGERENSEGSAEAMRDEAEAARTLADVYRDLRTAMSDYAAAKMDGAKEQAGTIGEQDLARQSEALRLESLRRQALDSEARKATEAAAEHRAEVEAAAEQYESFAKIGVRAFGDLAAGEEGALRSAVTAIGEELQARGSAGLWEAAMMAWVPGMQAQAAGLAATSALAVAAGGVMRRTGRVSESAGAGVGSVSSGAIAPQQAAPVQRVSNTTSVVLNYSTLASTRESQIALGGALRGAVANGYA